MTLEELIMDKKKRTNRKRRLTKDERRTQVRDWCTFYRRNWDIYATDRLGINLKPFQLIYSALPSEVAKGTKLSPSFRRTPLE